MILVCENLINLAYYKDVVFGAMLILEFSGIYYNSLSGDVKDDS